MEQYNNISFCFCKFIATFILYSIFLYVNLLAKLTIECTQWRRGCRKVVFQGSVWGTPAQRSRTIRRQAAADPLDRTLQGCHKHTAPRLDQRTTNTHTHTHSASGNREITALGNPSVWLMVLNLTMAQSVRLHKWKLVEHALNPNI